MKMRRSNMKKPFMEHLQELNNRILFSFTLVGIVAIFVYNQYSFFGDILLEPLINAGYDDSNIFALTIYEGFQVKLQNTFWISIIITFPLILLILGYFVKPALEIRTLSFSLYFIFFTLLFYSGIFSSLSIAHVGIEFLLSFNENEIILRSQNYFQFITRISLLFGVSFQLPLIMLFLLNKGIIKVKSLTNKRAEMFIVILIFSAVITPTGDPISLFIFTLPMYLLIEIMIFIHKKSNREF
jgi:sec-independent protein translocase protein TatC